MHSNDTAPSPIDTPTVELVPALPDQAARDTYRGLVGLVLADTADADELAEWEDEFGLRHDGADFDTAERRLWPVVATAGYRRTQVALAAVEERYGDDRGLRELVEAAILDAFQYADWETAMRVRLHLARVQAVLDPEEAIALWDLTPGRWCEACGAPTMHLVVLITERDEKAADQWEMSLCEACVRRHPGAVAYLDQADEDQTPETAPLPIPRRSLHEDTGLGWRDLVTCTGDGPLWAARHRGRTVYTDRMSMWDTDLMGLRIHEAFPVIEDGQKIQFLGDAKTLVTDDPAGALDLANAWNACLPLDLPDELELKRWEPTRVTWSAFYTDEYTTGITGLIGTTGDGRAVGIAPRLSTVAVGLGLTAYLSADGKTLRVIGTDLDERSRTVGAIRVHAIAAATDPVLAAIAAVARGPVGTR